MIGILLVVVVSLLTCGGQLCQKQASLRWQQPDAQRLLSTLSWLALAAILLGLSMVVWLTVLQRLPLSLAYPMLSFNFVLVTLAARWVYHEPATARHWCGVASIILGILLMSVHS